jgi:hypothetical protein
VQAGPCTPDGLLARPFAEAHRLPRPAHNPKPGQTFFMGDPVAVVQRSVWSEELWSDSVLLWAVAVGLDCCVLEQFAHVVKPGRLPGEQGAQEREGR